MNGHHDFIVVAMGSTGDVNPMLGIALELLHRGHNVTFLANPVFEPYAKAGGLKFARVGAESDYQFVWDPDNWRWWRVAAALKKGWLPFMLPTYKAIASQSRPLGTVLVANSVATGAQFAHEKFSLPLVMVTPHRLIFESLDESPNYGPFQSPPRWLGRPARRIHRRFTDRFIDRAIGKGVKAIRSKLGLPRQQRILSHWVKSADRVVGLWPEWFAKTQSSWPRNLTLTGFLNYDRDKLEEPVDVSQFHQTGQESPIVFTCGSAMTHAQAFMEVAVGVHRILEHPVIVVTDAPIQPTSPLPAGVRYLPYVPFSRLLPRAAAIVHHGGIGTCAASFAAGIPQVIAPLAYDQFDNADICERLGVAQRVSRHLLTARRVSHQLNSLLDSRITDRCRTIAERMNPAAAMSGFCDAVEALR